MCTVCKCDVEEGEEVVSRCCGSSAVAAGRAAAALICGRGWRTVWRAAAPLWRQSDLKLIFSAYH